MVKDEFDPEAADWFVNKKVWIDLGYKGFDKNFKTLELHIPNKRKRRKKKTDPRIEFTKKRKCIIKKFARNVFMSNMLLVVSNVTDSYLIA